MLGVCALYCQKRHQIPLLTVTDPTRKPTRANVNTSLLVDGVAVPFAMHGLGPGNHGLSGRCTDVRPNWYDNTKTNIETVRCFEQAHCLLRTTLIPDKSSHADVVWEGNCLGYRYCVFLIAGWYSSETHGRYGILSGLLWAAGRFGIWVKRTSSRKRPMYDILGVAVG